MKCVHRELKKLVETGIIRGQADGKYRYYTLDICHPAYEELRSIFAKTRQGCDHVPQSPSVSMWEN